MFGYADKKSPHRLLHMPLAPEIANLSAAHARFVAGRSMRDVEPSVALNPRDPHGRKDRQRGRPRMSKNAQRLSQVVSTFGPGAMVDLPTRSVIVGGLELWEMRGDAFTTIPEPRITLRLEQLLKQQGRLEQSKSLSLRTPPVADGRPGRLPSYIVAPVFPAYFVCEQVEIVTVDGKPARRRRLVRWQDLDPRGGRRKFVFDDGKKSDVTPIRFVCACEKGHLQDINWKWVVHGNEPCQEPMWVEEKGTSADPADMSIVCGCGKQALAAVVVPAGAAGKLSRRTALAARSRPERLRSEAQAADAHGDQHLFSAGLHRHLAAERGGRAHAPRRRTVGRIGQRADRAGRRNGQAVQFEGRGDPRQLSGRGDFRAAARAFARARPSTPAARRNCPSSTCSRAVGRRSGRTIRPQSSTLRPCRATPGPIRVLVSICR